MKKLILAGLSGLLAVTRSMSAHANVLAVETDAATGGIRELRIVKQAKIEMRLSHHLAFKDLWKHIHEAVMEHAKKFVRKSTLIITDPSDVQKKPYEKKMRILPTLQGDGSKEDVWRVVQGYRTRECAERSEGRSRSDGEAARQGPRASRRRYAS